MSRIILVLMALLCLSSKQSHAYNPDGELRIFLDCQFCDDTYYRQNLGHVEFVRDRKVADVHLLFVRQRNGSGGFTEKIQFIGLGEYVEVQDTVEYSTDVNMTADDKRKIQLKYIELGLVRYWLKKGIGDDLAITVSSPEIEVDTVEKDPWNYWVFGVNVGGWANGQENFHSINANASISARRVTEKNKFSFRARYNRNFQKYFFDEDVTTANQQSSWVNVQEVLSINNHWSYGFFASGGNSIFSNYRFYAEPRAGIEYNFFEYPESATKQLVVSYVLGARYNDYYDTTVFNKDAELLALHRLKLAGTVNQPWGSVSASASYQNYLHDFKLNSASFWLNLNVRLFKGFSWRINGGFDILHDQINLKKQGASFEDVLLQQQQLGTGYSYWMNMGINYSFGSIYNSIVNPRFDF